ncbi:hypothetical protein M0R45_008784 [Rubus argutus]|uniref:F-box domain-containing protein n=1 Tax=Rubus argutus TaxID=59490 RepID=A0AAW1Y3Y1_RUBAR
MSDYFPEDLMQKIFLRLPVKSLIKSTAVCKSWMSLIKSSTFIQSHLLSTIDSNYKNDTHLILQSASSYSVRDRRIHHHHCLRWDSPEFSEYSKLLNPVVVNRNRNLSVVGTCNGLVCLQSDTSFHSDRSPTLLWNPSIRKIVILPSPPTSFTSDDHYLKFTTHGFGYDSHSGDYKILRIVTLIDPDSDSDSDSSGDFEVQVYSLARGCWKSLIVLLLSVKIWSLVILKHMLILSMVLFIFLKHVCVWFIVIRMNSLNLGGDNFITSFNLATELFGQVMMPQALGKDRCFLSRYGESLALIKYKDDWEPPSGCHLWVMKEYGVAESWTFLFNIAMVEVQVYGFKRSGEVVLMEINLHAERRMISLDPKSNQVKVFGTEDYKYYFMDSFVESLVLLDHANAMSVRGGRN